MGASGQRERMRGDERRALILAQAKKVFARLGYAQASMGELARASEVTEALLYRHFESKKELYLTVLQEVTEHFLTTFCKQVEEKAKYDPLEALSTLLVDSRAAARADPDSLQILLAATVEADDPQVIEGRQLYHTRIFALIHHLLTTAQEQGILPAHLDLTAATWGYFSLISAIPLRVSLHLTEQITEQTLREVNRLWVQTLLLG